MPIFAGFDLAGPVTPSGVFYLADVGYLETFKPGGNSWIGTVRAYDGKVAELRLHVFCEYTRFTQLTPAPSTSVSVPPGKTATTTVSCPDGWVLINGGFDVPDGHGVYVLEDAPAQVSDPSPGPFTSWRVTGYNFEKVPHQLYAYAECVTVEANPRPTPTLTGVHPTATKPPIGLKTPVALPTSTPKPKPTATTPSARGCLQVATSTAVLDTSDFSYFDVDTGQRSHTSTGADLHWVTLSGISGGYAISPVNSAHTSDRGAASFSAITCAQLQGYSYGSGSVRAVNNEVFAVKTASGRYAKLQMYYTGGSSITLLWALYQLT